MAEYTTSGVGRIGEDIACRFLMKRGFSIVGRNYWKKWGEIDVIARKGKTWHFIEVKAVRCKNLENVSHETDEYRPEENVHPQKLKRLYRTIQTYLLEKGIEDEWQLDVLAVFLDLEKKQARCRVTENVIV